MFLFIRFSITKLDCTRTKLTKAIGQLNLNSVLISEQPYVKNLNIFTIEQDSVFRIETDEIYFKLINYSDLDLDILNVRLVEENNYLKNSNRTFRTDDLLSNISLIENQNLDFNYNPNNMIIDNLNNDNEW